MPFFSTFKRLVTGGLFCSILMTVPVFASEPSDWAMESIEAAIAVEATTPELMEDYQASLTREGFVELLINTYETVIGEEISVEGLVSPFADTDSVYVIKASVLDIAKGTSDSTFDPEGVMSREQMIVMFSRLIKALEQHYEVSILSASDTPLDFEDFSDISPWAVSDIESAINMGILQGQGDAHQKINPQRISTNEEALVMNLALLNYLDEKGFIMDSAAAQSPDTEAEEIAEESPEEPVYDAAPDVDEEGNIRAFVIADILNMRSTPDLSDSSNIIHKLKSYEEVTITGETGEWYAIVTSDGLTGYVHQDYLHPYTATEDISDLRMEIVAYSKQYVGTPYRYAGNSLTGGIDCSGFTSQVYKAFGYSLSRSSSGQGSDGVAIGEGELLPGDLVLYGYSGSISHVAIYVGDGQIIHATTSNGVMVTEMRDYLRKPLIGFRRVLL